MTHADLHLNPDLDVDGLAAAFSETKRLHIKKIFGRDTALHIQDVLVNQTPWQYTYFDGARNHTVPIEQFDRLDADSRNSIDETVRRAAEKGFSYSYNSFNFHQRIRQGEDVGDAFAEIDAFLNSEPFLRSLSQIVGDPDISGTDASASWYGHGHFLNIHDDKRPKYDLRAAFVLNLSPLWRTDWGGELKFFSNRRGAKFEDAYFPSFNALNIFKVPQYHAVGMIAPFAGAPRHSISGWLYAGDDPY